MWGEIPAKILLDPNDRYLWLSKTILFLIQYVKTWFYRPFFMLAFSILWYPTRWFELDWAVPHSDFLDWLSGATLRFLSLVFQVGFWCCKKKIWCIHWVEYEVDINMKTISKMKTPSKIKTQKLRQPHISKVIGSF